MWFFNLSPWKHIWCLAFYWHLFSVHNILYTLNCTVQNTRCPFDCRKISWDGFSPSSTSPSMLAVSSPLFSHQCSEVRTQYVRASFPGPAQLSVTCNTESGGEPDIFSHVSDVRIERIVELCEGALGPEQQTGPRYCVTYHMYLASRRRICVVGWTIHEMQPVSFANFHLFPITSCSHEKRYQASVLQVIESWAGPGNEAKYDTCEGGELC